MDNILQTVLTTLLPAATTGVVTYLVSSKTLKSEMEKIHSEHEHDLEKLATQYSIDIESIKKAHKLEMEKLERMHEQELDTLKLQHNQTMEAKEKELNHQTTSSMLTAFLPTLLKMPEVKEQLTQQLKKKA
jgi:F0F1-type ATP synthase membrane subunit b/b'